MTRRARTKDSLLTRIGRRLTKDGDGLLALLVASAAFVVAFLDVFGNDLVGPDGLTGAILFVLALLAATLLRDRQTAKAMADQGVAVRQVDAYAADQERLDATSSTARSVGRSGMSSACAASRSGSWTSTCRRSVGWPRTRRSEPWRGRGATRW